MRARAVPGTAHRDLLGHHLEGEGAAFGSPVLLLNGIMMTIASWDGVARKLAPVTRLLRCDLRGQLLSPGRPPARVAEHTEDLLVLLDHLGIDQVHLVGTSFGGIVGGYLAARHADRVQSYVTIASADRFDGPMSAEVERWQAACQAVLAGGDRGLLADTIQPVVFSAAWRRANASHQSLRRQFFAALDDTWYAGLNGLLASALSVDLSHELGRISCPSLVVAAGEDGFIPRPRCRALAEAIPGAWFDVIEGAGHGVVAEQPERVAECCVRFLEAVR